MSSCFLLSYAVFTTFRAMNILKNELEDITLSFRMANKSQGKKQLNSINDGQAQHLKHASQLLGDTL